MPQYLFPFVYVLEHPESLLQCHVGIAKSCFSQKQDSLEQPQLSFLGLTYIYLIATWSSSVALGSICPPLADHVLLVSISNKSNQRCPAKKIMESTGLAQLIDPCPSCFQHSLPESWTLNIIWEDHFGVNKKHIQAFFGQSTQEVRAGHPANRSLLHFFPVGVRV